MRRFVAGLRPVGPAGILQQESRRRALFLPGLAHQPHRRRELRGGLQLAPHGGRQPSLRVMRRPPVAGLAAAPAAPLRIQPQLPDGLSAKARGTLLALYRRPSPLSESDRTLAIAQLVRYLTPEDRKSRLRTTPERGPGPYRSATGRVDGYGGRVILAA